MQSPARSFLQPGFLFFSGILYFLYGVTLTLYPGGAILRNTGVNTNRNQGVKPIGIYNRQTIVAKLEDISLRKASIFRGWIFYYGRFRTGHIVAMRHTEE
ncbi:MAG: hypothetical protein KDC80_15200 [Saprospiraceae bacterium]|nr:hypothetical protein [Saprospiraceae bacterium]